MLRLPTFSLKECLRALKRALMERLMQNISNILKEGHCCTRLRLPTLLENIRLGGKSYPKTNITGEKKLYSIESSCEPMP
jgi:hypothetical protein